MPINHVSEQFKRKPNKLHLQSSDNCRGGDLLVTCLETRGARQCDVSGLESCMPSAMPGFAMRPRRASPMTKVWLPVSTEWLGAAIFLNDWGDVLRPNALDWAYFVAMKLSFRQIMGAADIWAHTHLCLLRVSEFFICHFFSWFWFWASNGKRKGNCFIYYYFFSFLLLGPGRKRSDDHGLLQRGDFFFREDDIIVSLHVFRAHHITSINYTRDGEDRLLFF